MKYKAVKGMDDILPRDVGIWQELERRGRRELELWGYREIRTPIVEDTSVFTRSIGETTDIVTKQMYAFEDKKGRSLTLRPEGTAPIVRAYVEHSLDKTFPEADGKFYYIGPMFRNERPQKGRSRQFHQIGVEIIGSSSAQVDGEVIRRLNKMLQLFKLDNFVIKINSLGCEKGKTKFAKRLKDYLKDKKSRLCEDCKRRIDKNILRVLDCKNETCIAVVKNAPNIRDSLCQDCVNHFALVKAVLEVDKINFKDTRNLVRGLDYYTRTVFEVTHPKLGSQDALAAGGRYDNLVKQFGGPDVGAAGYAIGIERVIMALREKSELLHKRNVIYIATIGDNARTKGIRIGERLRDTLQEYIVLMSYREASLKSQMRNADKNDAKLVVILGENEIKANKVILRDMRTKEQAEIPSDKAVEEIIRKVNAL
jgi:histidyl-tRNA synthetase